MVDNRLQALVAPIDIDGSLVESIDCSADRIDWSLDMLGSLELHSNHFHIFRQALGQQIGSWKKIGMHYRPSP